MMQMDEAVWSRHASPWSVWTRFTVIPLFTVAAWSRVWLGWSALAPVAAVVLWAWWNPRAFPPPSSTNNWASKGTFGERVFIERRNVDVPPHHMRAAHVLTALTALGALLWLYGLVVLNAWATLAGMLATMLSKAWFIDRMVWIYEDFKDRDPKYAAWLR